MNAIAQEVFFSSQDSKKQLNTHFEPEHAIMWLRMNPAPRPCFTPELLAELRDYQKGIASTGGKVTYGGKLLPMRYQVFASGVPNVFNLGGDLRLFTQLIQVQDRMGLLRYARACIDVLFPNAVNYELPITTISLVQGDALGGGFEAALSSGVLIAERSAKMGLPEVLFNLFPGMGAYSFLARRLDAARAERMILSGRMYSAEELHEMGVVDILAEDGEGEDAVYNFIRKQSRASNSYHAIQKVRQRFQPITYQELMDVTTIWVDAALQLEAKDLRVMERLVRAQEKLKEAHLPEVAGVKIA